MVSRLPKARPEMTKESSDKAFTFRAILTGELGDFLADEGLSSQASVSAIVALVAQLVHHREEGVELSPDIYLCHDASKLASILGGAELLAIGDAPLNDGTARQALKLCAPLAVSGYSIYIQRNLDDTFAYGLVRATNLPLAVTPEEALSDLGDGSIPAVMVRKIARDCVEALGAKGNRRRFHFSAARDDTAAPKAAIAALASAITTNIVDEVHKDNTRRFLDATLAQIFQESHGALAVVLQPGREATSLFSDTVPLKQPIRFAERVAAFASDKSANTLASLQGAASLMEGMFHCDGIVVFDSDGAICSFRAFHHTESDVESQNANTGGSRRRTYDALKGLVGKGISLAFFRSQDGHTEAYTGEQE